MREMRSIHEAGPSRFLAAVLLPFAVFPFALAACGGDAGAGGSAPEGEADVRTSGVSTRDSAGVTIVTSTGSGWTAAEAWRLEPALTVGATDGPLAFGEVGWVSVDPAPSGDTLYVLDRQSNRVHVIGPDGERVRDFGGEGEGPGEFQHASYVGLVTGGRVAVGETFPPALHWLRRDGTYIGTVRLGPTASGEDAGSGPAAMFGVWRTTREGAAVVQAMTFSAATIGEGSENVLLRYPAPDDPERGPGDVPAPDTLASWRGPAAVQPASLQLRIGEARGSWGLADDGRVALSSGTTYEIRLLGRGGDPRRIIRRDVDPIRVDDALRAELLEAARAQMSGADLPESMLDQMLDGATVAPVLPQVIDVWLSASGDEVWVGVPDGSSAERILAGDPAGWDVFAADGAYLGRVEAPAGFQLTYITEGALYGIWRDELDISYARGYRIVRPTPAEPAATAATAGRPPAGGASAARG